MVKKCPACGSKNISFYIGGEFGKYKCKDCGYVGPIVVEIDKDETHSRGC